MDLSESSTPDVGSDEVSREALGRPRWVTVAFVVAAGLVVLFVVLQLVGGGEHGPGRHTGLGEALPVVNEDSHLVVPVEHGA